jgi:hypothetical protein
METEHLLIEDQEKEDLDDTVNQYSEIKEHASKMNAALRNSRSNLNPMRSSIPLPNEKAQTRVARIREALDSDNRSLRGSVSLTRPSRAQRKADLKEEKELRIQ